MEPTEESLSNQAVVNSEVGANFSEVKTSQDLDAVFPHLNMKLPIAVQNCVPTGLQEVVVITSTGGFLNEQKIPLSTFYQPSGSESLGKRICIEQDGQTFILALQDDLEVFPNALEIQPKNFTSLDGTQLLNFGEGQSMKAGINQNWFTSREEKTSLHNKGHLWKQGMWSKEEIDLLESNIQIYCKDHDIDNPATVVFEMSKEERKDFYRMIAKGLNRPLFSVYRRVIRMYDNKNHVGKYTSEELAKLKNLRSVYGNDWQAIGAAMGRSASSIKDRCRLMKDNCNQGKWLPAEERRLAESVYDLANALPGEMISSGLSWAVVAERVGTRSEKQCRTKWLNYLNWKVAGGTEWTREDDLTLICRVYGLNVEDENLVDWNELSKDWLSVRSPQWLRGKWWSLKRHIPNSNTLSFQEIGEYLYQHFVLKVKVKDEDGGHSKLPLLQQSIPAPLVVTTPAQMGASSVVTLTNTASCVDIGAVPVLQTLEVLPQNIHLANPHTFLLQPPPPAPSHIIIQTIPAAEDISERTQASTQMPSPSHECLDEIIIQDSDNDESAEAMESGKSTHLISSDPMLADAVNSDMELEKN